MARAELQIRGCIEDNLKNNSLNFITNTYVVKNNFSDFITNTYVVTHNVCIRYEI